MSQKTVWDTVVIVGVGLIGGSIGQALRKRKLARQVLGVGRRPAVLRTAVARNAIDQASPDLEAAVRDADLVIVCTPLATICKTVQAVRKSCRADTLITDVGSTKASIVGGVESAAGRSRSAVLGTFVGSHPIAGSDKSGVEFADPDLFDGRMTIVTPPSAASFLAAHADSVEQVCDFWRSLGSRLALMTPEAHDEALAATSHLPHLVASALAGDTPLELREFVGPGWRDTTRIAAADSSLWTEILIDNGRFTLQALDRLVKRLKAFRSAIGKLNSDELQHLLHEGKTSRDAMGN
ncbi:MAG: prephenate dehydrogenase/arogenate dehydrogenase family protein [Planctomycetes bacterium]|nr:prephenate dehydrogenase/arogenate dehydrogenase family protein [Planctomycetota bacterium]